ncbi:hypothetical protein ACFYE2_08020 [Kocuria sp. CPCC 205300]
MTDDNILADPAPADGDDAAAQLTAEVDAVRSCIDSTEAIRWSSFATT